LVKNEMGLGQRLWRKSIMLDNFRDRRWVDVHLGSYKLGVKLLDRIQRG